MERLNNRKDYNKWKDYMERLKWKDYNNSFNNCIDKKDIV